MELWILAAFSAALIACLASGKSLILALLAGFLLFFSYGVKTGHPFSEMARLAVSGVKTAKNVIVTLILVGMLTAAWRVSGTIPYIVYHASQWCDGSAVLLASFLLCALVSALTGTSFGTAATIGVICMTIANSMNIPPMYSGGAIMAGAYFGDRCSPMSTSALLVAAITKTDIFTNCRLMVKTAMIPFVLTCAVYAAMGLLFQDGSAHHDAAGLFRQAFTLSWITLIPAALVIILSARHVDVKLIMIASTAAAAAIAVGTQQMNPLEVLTVCLLGFHPANPALARLASGGGAVSMTDVVAIICISSSYAGMFSGTGFLHRIQGHMAALSRRPSYSGPYGGSEPARDALRRHHRHIRRHLNGLLQPNPGYHADAPALPVCRTRSAALSYSPGKHGHRHFRPRPLVYRLLGLSGDYRRAPGLSAPGLLLIFHPPLELPNQPPEATPPPVQ